MTDDDFTSEIRRLRKARKLHSTVESRLVYLLGKIHPDSAAVPEVHAVLGGRNDLIMFSFNARKVAFELFATATQVPQDLRLLEQNDAEVKVAILLDQAIDETVANEYFHKKPQPFPFIWTRQLIDTKWERYVIVRLRELTEENSNVVRLRKLLDGPYSNSVDTAMRNVIDKLESQIRARRPQAPLDVTGFQAIAFRIVSDLQKLGIPNDRLRSLYQWLLQGLEFGVLLVVHGFQAFLITDLQGEYAIWSDGDLADDLIIMTPTPPKAQVVLCLNPIINRFFQAMKLPPSEIKYHFFHGYEEFMQTTANSPHRPKKRKS